MDLLKCIIFAVTFVTVAGDNSAIVKTKYGNVKGTLSGVSRDGKKFYEFLGVQYALVTERFKPSTEPNSWEGTRLANQFGPTCNDTRVHGDENCLFMNIYTPQINPLNSTLLPVIFYIHGGSFKDHSGQLYGPNYFMDGDVVFVNFNYRMGILGFLSTEDLESPGNYGLKDQVMALNWVKENIGNFRGDPSRVTIMGNSAGSASVTYHLVSPLSKGLFQNAIAQSGTFLDPWAFTRNPRRYAKRVAERVGCEDTSDSKAIVDCLKGLPAPLIMNASRELDVYSKFFRDPLAAFGPVIEPEGVKAFLDKSPVELLRNGESSKVPLLAGVVKEEGIYLWAGPILFSDGKLESEARQKFQENFAGVAPAALYFDERAPKEKLTEIGKKIEQFYFNGKFSLENEQTFNQLANLYSDRLFVASMIRFMNLYARHAPTYPYLYTFNKFVGIEFNDLGLNIKTNGDLDATHVAELDMLVSPLFNKTRVDPVHDELSRNMIKLWSLFIHEGAPKATYGSEKEFPSICPNEGLKTFYQLDTDTKLIENIFAERVAFWESLGLEDYNFNSS